MASPNPWSQLQSRPETETWTLNPLPGTADDELGISSLPNSNQSGPLSKSCPRV